MPGQIPQRSGLHISIARYGQLVSSLSLQVNDATASLLWDFGADQAQHGTHLFDILACAMNGVGTSAFLQGRERMLDSLLGQAWDRLCDGFSSFETKGHGLTALSVVRHAAA